jgi:hypothetical protein
MIALHVPFQRTFFLAIFSLAVSFSGFAQTGKLHGPGVNNETAGFLNGLKKIGPNVGDDYPSLTTALTALSAEGMDGDVTLELQAGYISSAETFPINFQSFAGNTTFTLTVRPATGVSGLTITTNAATTILMQGARNVIIDGRSGGTGSVKELTIANTAVDGKAIHLIDDAVNNTIQYLNIRSAAASAANGVIVVGTSSGTSGNDDNRIQLCDIGNATGTAANLIFAEGSAGLENDHNEILGNNFFNYFSTTVHSSAIQIVGNNTAWTISGNSFYQTAARGTRSNIVYSAIAVNTPGHSFVISNNFIGGNAPLCAGAVSAYTGTGSYLAIFLTLGNGGIPTTIDNNTIQNISINMNQGTVHAGIYVNSGKINCGTAGTNTIGKTGIGNSIALSSVGTVGSIPLIFFGFYANVSDSVIVRNNIIAAISGSGTGPLSIYGIRAGGSNAYYAINSNTIGDPNFTNSIVNASNRNILTGIISLGAGSTTDVAIDSNIVSNLRGNAGGAGFNSETSGILASGGRHYIRHNIVRQISGSGGSEPGPSGIASLVGIIHTNGTGPYNIADNTVYDLVHTRASGNFTVIGIYNCAASTTGLYEVERNFVHSLSASTSGTATIDGIYTACDSAGIYNNMVRLGIDAAGANIPRNDVFNGIRQGLLSGPQRISHNSVFIGGNYGGFNHTYAFFTADSLQSKVIANNLFVNNRQVTTGTGISYAIRLHGTKTDQPGQLLESNIYKCLYGYIGRFRSTDFNTMHEWREATGLDSLSGLAALGEVGFVNPIGNSSTVNLHISGASGTESAGTVSNTITTDIDAQTRSPLSPVDIGADAGHFTPVDVIAPMIYHTPLQNTTSTANRVMDLRIKDIGTGVVSSGILMPRVWYRRLSPTTSAWVNNVATLFSGNVNDGIWRFTIDYAALGGVMPTATYQYYLAVEDLSSNLYVTPAQEASLTDVASPFLAPKNPVTYRVLDLVPAMINVGAGERFTSLTGADGLFRYLNDNVYTQNVAVTVTSDLQEDGTHSLRADSSAGFTTTISPASATVHAIYNSGSLTTSMLRLVGAENFIFDGSFNGSGRYLRFINTHVDSFSCWPVFQYDSASTHNALRNLIVESNLQHIDGLQGMIVFGPSGINGFNDITGCAIRDATGSPGKAGMPLTAIATYEPSNFSLKITGNEIFNFRNFGYRTLSSISPLIGDSTIIDSNHFYYNRAVPAGARQQAIATAPVFSISGNYIGVSAPFCGGSPWINNGVDPFSAFETPGVAGIVCSQLNLLEPVRIGYITNNVIKNISLASTGAIGFSGIVATGRLHVENNMIGDSVITNSIENFGSQAGCSGINAQAFAVDSVWVRNNHVAGIKMWGTTNRVGCIGLGGNGGAGYLTLTGNVVHDLSNAGSGSDIAGTAHLTGINISGLNSGGIIENNRVYNLKGTGTGAGKTALVVGMRAEGFHLPRISHIRRNRIYNLTNTADSGFTFGIHYSVGVTLSNNQITITDTNTNRLFITGIGMDPIYTADTNYFYYNSVFIGGISGGGDSYAFTRKERRGVRSLRNNLLYNERTGGGGLNIPIALGINLGVPPENWPPGTSDYNFFVSTDSLIGQFGAATPLRSISGWRQVSLCDSSSLAALNTHVPASSFFKSIATGDLSINNNDSICWYVNGKGIPISHIGSDFDSGGNVRSTSIATGSTDIGSDEFNTTTLPPVLMVLGRHMPGETDTLQWGSRTIATITWGNTGILPTIGAARLFSQSWPNDPTNDGTSAGARYMNSYLQIPVTGGSGYTYSLTLHFDSAMLGKVINAPSMVITKKQTGVDSSWQVIVPTTVNIAAKTMTIHNQTSFSEFTATDTDATFRSGSNNVCPDGTTTFTIPNQGVGYSYRWQVDTDGDGVFVDIAPGGVYSGVTTRILKLTNAPTAYYGYTYRAVATNGSTTYTSDPVVLRFVSSWVGTSSNTWENPANWSCGKLPDGNTDVVIGPGVVNNPLINVNTSCRSITVYSPVEVTLGNGVVLQLTGK